MGLLLKPLRLFVRGCLQVGEGSLVGYRPTGQRQQREYADREWLCPAYLDYQLKRGLQHKVSHNHFASMLTAACGAIRYQCV